MEKVEVEKIEKTIQLNRAWLTIIIVFAMFICLIFFLRPNKKISGCYHITYLFYEDRGTSLCVNDSIVSLTHAGSKYTLYPKWYGDTLHIQNEYGNDLFSCTYSKEDSNSIQCKSHNNILGKSTNVWKKN